MASDCAAFRGELIRALHDAGTSDLRVVSNNCGVDEWGLGVLLSDHRISRVIASYVGENKEFARQYLSGELEVELTPQGTLAERLRAGGAGVPAFFTVTGVGTQVAEGGLPWRYAPDGSVAGLVAAEGDPGVHRAGRDARLCARGVDRRPTSRWSTPGRATGRATWSSTNRAANFNPLCATAGRVTIAQVEQLVDVGEIPPENVHTPGIYVQRVVALAPDSRSASRNEPCDHDLRRWLPDGTDP